MELKIVEEDGAKRLDTSVAEGNLDKYSRQCGVLEEVLERSRFECDNARGILSIMKSLSNCWINYDKPAGCFFFTGDEERALPEELAPLGLTVTEGYQVTSLDRVKKVKCPGCTEMRPLIGMQLSNGVGKLVICGNSIHKISIE